MFTPPWPKGRLELSSRAPPRSGWVWLIRRRMRTARLARPRPLGFLKLAQISKQASSQQQHTVFGTVRTGAPPLPGYTAMGELPGLEVPFVSRGLPHRIRLMASSTYGERASPPAQRPREGLSCVTLGQHPLVPLLGQLRRVEVWG